MGFGLKLKFYEEVEGAEDKWPVSDLNVFSSLGHHFGGGAVEFEANIRVFLFVSMTLN